MAALGASGHAFIAPHARRKAADSACTRIKEWNTCENLQTEDLLFMSDIFSKLWVLLLKPNDYDPDILVVCGGPKFGEAPHANKSGLSYGRGSTQIAKNLIFKSKELHFLSILHAKGLGNEVIPKGPTFGRNQPLNSFL